LNILVSEAKRIGGDYRELVENYKLLKYELSELKALFIKMKLSQQIINPLEVHGPTIEGEVQPLNYKRIALDMIDSSPLESLTCSALKTAYKRKNIDFPVVFERDLIIGQRFFFTFTVKN
jgi:hypothetical protein